MTHHQKKLKADEINVPDKEEKNEPVISFLECVLADDVTQVTLPLVDVYVGTVRNKKFIRNAIVGLNKVIPVSELCHLKRVKDGQVIICFASEGIEHEVLSKLSHLEFDLNLISDKLQIVKVAKCPPVTRKQFEYSSKFWPTNFHEDKYLESLLSSSLFSSSDLVRHKKWMRIAIEAAQKSSLRTGSVVVDPVRGELVAVAGDSRDEHPLKHSVMVALDLVARAEGGGAWSPHPADFFSKTLITDCKEESPYLCTGFYVYTTSEPCTMCAMALVHSRVKRVFYGVSSSNGALGTLQKIHTVKHLNHHFEVFKGLLQNEIMSLS